MNMKNNICKVMNMYFLSIFFISSIVAKVRKNNKFIASMYVKYIGLND